MKVIPTKDRYFNVEQHRVYFERTFKDAFNAFVYLFMYLIKVRPLLLHLDGSTCCYSTFRAILLIIHEFGHAFKDIKATVHRITVGYWTDNKTENKDKILIFNYGESEPRMLETRTPEDMALIAVGWGFFQMSAGDKTTYDKHKKGSV